MLPCTSISAPLLPEATPSSRTSVPGASVSVTPAGIVRSPVMWYTPLHVCEGLRIPETVRTARPVQSASVAVCSIPLTRAVNSKSPLPVKVTRALPRPLYRASRLGERLTAGLPDTREHGVGVPDVPIHGAVGSRDFDSDQDGNAGQVAVPNDQADAGHVGIAGQIGFCLRRQPFRAAPPEGNQRRDPQQCNDGNTHFSHVLRSENLGHRTPAIVDILLHPVNILIDADVVPESGGHKAGFVLGRQRLRGLYLILWR